MLLFRPCLCWIDQLFKAKCLPSWTNLKQRRMNPHNFFHWLQSYIVSKSEKFYLDWLQSFQGKLYFCTIYQSHQGRWWSWHQNSHQQAGWIAIEDWGGVWYFWWIPWIGQASRSFYTLHYWVVSDAICASMQQHSAEFSDSMRAEYLRAIWPIEKNVKKFQKNSSMQYLLRALWLSQNNSQGHQIGPTEINFLVNIESKYLH